MKKIIILSAIAFIGCSQKECPKIDRAADMMAGYSKGYEDGIRNCLQASIDGNWDLVEKRRAIDSSSVLKVFNQFNVESK